VRTGPAGGMRRRPRQPSSARTAEAAGRRAPTEPTVRNHQPLIAVPPAQPLFTLLVSAGRYH
jgi:hypothetical protein